MGINVSEHEEVDSYPKLQNLVTSVILRQPGKFTLDKVKADLIKRLTGSLKYMTNTNELSTEANECLANTLRIFRMMTSGGFII